MPVISLTHVDGTDSGLEVKVLASLVAQAVKNLPAMRETQETAFDPWVGKIPWRRNGDPLQHPCPGNSMTEAAAGLQFTGSRRVGNDCVTNTFTFTTVLYTGL